MIKNPLPRYLSKPVLLKVGYILIVSLPVILYVFKFSVLNRHGIFRGEDWDYFAQSYEAARQSILRFHQFPWWNPWMNGGQPLFANPQFGLISIQTPLVLLFGTVAGLHYSMLVYYILGFWGMYRLLQRIGSKSRLITVLLSYIWVFSTFAAWHLGGGQLTFALYLLAPWAFLATLNIHKKRGWLWFGLVASLLLLSAAHYITIEILIICVFIAVFQIIAQIRLQPIKNLRAFLPILRPYLLASVIIIALCGFRLYYTFQFIHEYPRLQPLDPAVPFKLFIAALTFRHPIDPASLQPVVNGIAPYGWSEYANYLGLGTLALFCYLAIRRSERLSAIRLAEWAVLTATGLAVLLTLGAFSSFSPFSLLHNLPVFNQMRVPSRFICWFGFGVILFLVRLPRKPVVHALLVISVIDVFLVGYPILNYNQRDYKPDGNFSSSVQQEEFFQTDPALGQINIMNIQDFRLLRATQQNVGEIYGYEPVLNIGEYYYLPGPLLCGVRQGCNFVRTNNAIVISWTPHKIILKRTATGPIQLNMNPGKVWQVNNRSPFSTYRILELQKPFLITDDAQDITVSYRPVL